MEFKSQPCTSVEQSKRLLELGLKKETADMVHYFSQSLAERWVIIPLDNGEVAENNDLEIPAWSLSRLFELCKPIPISYDWLYRTDDYYENMIACIAWKISKESFNPQFLKEKS